MEKIKPKPMASNDSSDLPVEPNNTIYADRTKACWLLTHEFKQCLKKSDCMQVQNRSAGDCIKADDGSVPLDCQKLGYTLFECRRSMLDMRTRFRGRKGMA